MADRLVARPADAVVLHDRANPRILLPELLWDAGRATSHRFNGFPARAVSKMNELANQWVVFATDFKDGLAGLFPHSVAELNPEWLFSAVDGGGDTAEFFRLVDAARGVARLQTNDANNDNAILAQRAGSFQYASGKSLMFSIDCAPQIAAGQDLFFGLAIEGDADPFNGLPTDGLFFEKAAAATVMDFHVRKNGASSESTPIDTAAMADDTFHRYDFRVNRDGSIDVFYDDDGVATISASDANLPDDERLAIYVGVQAGAAATRYLDIRHLIAACEL